MKGTRRAIAGSEDRGRGPRAKKWEWPLKAENQPQLAVGKEMGATILKPQGTEFCQQSE